MQHPAAVRTTAANKWIIAGTVVLGSFVSVMDISIVNVAMPQMISTFGVSLDAITWVAVAYSISEIILVTMAAWFSTLIGRKRFFVFSFILFTAASLLCGLARSLEMMILARILQGIGGGGLIPVSQAIMLETFPEEERGMAMALYAMGVTIAPAAGPVLGGWLTDQYGWPWIFYINLPLGAIGIGLSIMVLEDPPHLQRSLARVDVPGIILLGVGLTALQLFLERGEREQWFNSSFIVTLALIAGVSLAVLVVWELYAEEPVIHLRLLKNVPFSAGIGLGLIFGITLFGSTFVLPLFLQRAAGVFGDGFGAAAIAAHPDHAGGDTHRRAALQLGGQPPADQLRCAVDDGGIPGHVEFRAGHELDTHDDQLSAHRRRHVVHVRPDVGGRHAYGANSLPHRGYQPLHPRTPGRR